MSPSESDLRSRQPAGANLIRNRSVSYMDFMGFGVKTGGYAQPCHDHRKLLNS